MRADRVNRLNFAQQRQRAVVRWLGVGLLVLVCAAGMLLAVQAGLRLVGIQWGSWVLLLQISGGVALLMCLFAGAWFWVLGRSARASMESEIADPSR